MLFGLAFGFLIVSLLAAFSIGGRAERQGAVVVILSASLDFL